MWEGSGTRRLSATPAAHYARGVTFNSISCFMNSQAQVPAAQSPTHGEASHATGPGLTIAALGVVFGDIGTSPLYAFKETLNPEHGVAFTPDSVLGLLSLIFWGLMFVVTLKYVVFVLRADHDGEGGILALQALARNAAGGTRTRPWLWNVIGALGLVGAFVLIARELRRIAPAAEVVAVPDADGTARPGTT